MFHLAGFHENVDPGGNYTKLTALDDARLFTQGDDVRVPVLNQVAFVFGTVDQTTAADARLVAPSLGLYGNHYLGQFPADSDLASGLWGVTDQRMNSITLSVDEILNAEINSNPANAQQQCVLIGFSDGQVSPINQPGIITVKGTLNGSSIAGQWTLKQLTLTQNLPQGNYGIIGMRYYAQHALAARVVLRTGEQWRPGCFGSRNSVDVMGDFFRNGNLGLWGTFPFQQPPDIEVLDTEATAGGTVYLDLLQV